MTSAQMSMMSMRRVPARSVRWRRLPLTHGHDRRSAHSTTLASTTPCPAVVSSTPAARGTLLAETFDFAALDEPAQMVLSSAAAPDFRQHGGGHYG